MFSPLLHIRTNYAASRMLNSFSDKLLTQIALIDCETFMQVKAMCHTARLVMSWRESGTVRVSPWPGNAPDLYGEQVAAH